MRISNKRRSSISTKILNILSLLQRHLYRLNRVKNQQNYLRNSLNHKNRPLSPHKLRNNKSQYNKQKQLQPSLNQYNHPSQNKSKKKVVHRQECEAITNSTEITTLGQTITEMTETQAIITGTITTIITRTRTEAITNPPVNTARIDNIVRIRSISLKINSSTRLEITKITNNTKRILEKIAAILH